LVCSRFKSDDIIVLLASGDNSLAFAKSAENNVVILASWSFSHGALLYFL